jgi:hypothetical protein
VEQEDKEAISGAKQEMAGPRGWWSRLCLVIGDKRLGDHGVCDAWTVLSSSACGSAEVFRGLGEVKAAEEGPLRNLYVSQHCLQKVEPLNDARLP